MKALAMAVLLAGVPADDEEVVWVFFSPDSPDATPIFAQLRGRRVRPALLVERYAGKREPLASFVATLQVSGEVRVVDDDALAMARRLGIRQLPAVALLRGDHAHVAAGTSVDVKELLRCSK